MTFYQYFDLFFNVLHLFKNLLKLNRLTATNEKDKETNSFANKMMKEIEYSKEAPVFILK